MRNKLLSLLSILIGSMSFGVEDEIRIGQPVYNEDSRRTEYLVKIVGEECLGAVLRIIHSWDEADTKTIMGMLNGDDKQSEKNLSTVAMSLIGHFLNFIPNKIQACMDKVPGSIIYMGGAVDQEIIRRIKQALEREGFTVHTGSNKGTRGVGPKSRNSLTRSPVPSLPGVNNTAGGDNVAHALNFDGPFDQGLNPLRIAEDLVRIGTPPYPAGANPASAATFPPLPMPGVATSSTVIHWGSEGTDWNTEFDRWFEQSVNAPSTDTGSSSNQGTTTGSDSFPFSNPGSGSGSNQAFSSDSDPENN